MTKTAHGKLFIISAPSGAGKTSLSHALIASDDNIVMSVSHTTRSQRNGEMDGQDYHFITQKEFLVMVEEAQFLEYAEVYGNYYGTSKKAVEALINEGKNVILDIDWQGAQSMRSIMPEAVSISILPPSVYELEARLRSRGSDSEDVIQCRMEQAIDEMQHCHESDYIVLNDNFNEALNDLMLIVSGQGDRIRPLKVDLERLLVAS